MNHDRTLRNLAPRWPGGDIKRLPFSYVLFLLPAVLLIWPLGGIVRSQAAAIGHGLAPAPVAAPPRAPSLSDPLIDRLAAGAQISADGRVIVYTAPEAGCVQPCPAQVLVEDTATGKREIVSLGLAGMAANGTIQDPSLSRDGRYVTYSSPASNLVQGDTNAASDIFIYDRTARATRRLSLAPDGRQADGDSYTPALSADGRFITFVSYAGNLAAGDTNQRADVFLANLEKGDIRRLSVDAAGQQANRDAHRPAISADGKMVLFSSAADNLVSGDTNAAEDVFMMDIEKGGIERLSVALRGSQADGDSFDAVMSMDGGYVAFASYAKSLTSDNNPGVNVFLRDLKTNETHCVSCDLMLREGGQAAWKPRFNPDGSLLLFEMLIRPASADAAQRIWQVYGYDRQHDQVYRLTVAQDGSGT